MHRFSRRALLTWGSVAAGAVTLPTAGVAAWAWTNAGRTNLGRVRFVQPLAIPPLAEPA